VTLPGSDLWKEQRRSILTASDFGAACGLNPYCSRQELWRRKINKTDIVINKRMQWGLDHEQAAIRAYTKATGRPVSPPAGLYRSDKYPSLGCTPDGLVGGLGLIECKCPEFAYNHIPTYYLTQMVGQLALLEREWCDFAVWTLDELVVWRVKDKGGWEWMLPYLKAMSLFLSSSEEPPRFRKKPKGSEFMELVEIEEKKVFFLTDGVFYPTNGQ
jgi:putative phage-type endonuclease